MTTALVTTDSDMTPQTVEAVLLGGDLERLSPQQRVSYMLSVCKSIGLNHLTKPFEFIRLNGKLVMYARKDCTEQLRKINGVSIKIVAREYTEGVYVVTAQATDRSGRTDESIGAVPIEKLTGEAKANAIMKAETKAKRRVTLSISGLGILDETEVDSIPGAQAFEERKPPQRAIVAEVVAAPPAEPSKTDEAAGAIAKINTASASELDAMVGAIKALKERVTAEEFAKVRAAYLARKAEVASHA